MAICPAHPDTDPSLSLAETEEGKLLVHCWGGCGTEDVLETLGLTLRDLFPSLYALQFSPRRPKAPARVRGGGPSAEAAEPTPEQCAEWERLLRGWKPPRYAVNQLAVQLRLPRESLLALHFGYDPEENCWIFPERDDSGRIVGLLRRSSAFCMRSRKS